MEDKKMMKIINENHKKAYEEYIKNEKRKNKKAKAKKIILLTIVFISIAMLFIKIIKEDNKLVNECMANGTSKEVCLYELQR